MFLHIECQLVTSISEVSGPQIYFPYDYGKLNFLKHKVLIIPEVQIAFSNHALK